jgi:hypothetical protein
VRCVLSHPVNRFGRNICLPAYQMVVSWLISWSVNQTSPSPLWSSGQGLWLQIQRSWFDFWCYKIFWEVVVLEWGPLSFVSTTEELLERRSSGSGLENREYGHTDPSLWPRDTLYPQTLALTLPTSGSRSVGIIRSRTKALSFFYLTSQMVMQSLTQWLAGGRDNCVQPIASQSASNRAGISQYFE